MTSDILKIQFTIELTDEFYENILCTMLEGGSNYWIRSYFIDHPDGDKPSGVPRSTWAASALNKGGTIIFFPDDSDEGVTLTSGKLTSGVRGWVFKHPDQVSFTIENNKPTIDEGNIDANNADCILQYALFGKLVYG